MPHKRVLVVAAHPDDEVLGCGGSIAAHVRADDQVRVLFMADGVGARGATAPEAERRSQAAHSALMELGVVTIDSLDFPDNAMDSVPLIQIVQAIEPFVDSYKPDWVYTHHGGDLNVDHRLTHEAVMTCLRPQPGAAVSTILAFEVMSSTEWRAPYSGNAFIPDWFQDISETLHDKIRALECYKLEMKTWPHARSLDALVHLAKYRGACLGVDAAEAFKLLRHRVKL